MFQIIKLQIDDLEVLFFRFSKYEIIQYDKDEVYIFLVQKTNNN